MKGPLAILGPGTLGCSAAQWAAECGLETRLLGRTRDHAEAGLRTIQQRWVRAISKGELTPEARDQALARLSAWAFEAPALDGAAAFLEALPEHPEVKVPFLTSVGQWGHPDLLILSGTSALSIGELARKSRLVGRLVGFHLFVPVPRMAVVEVAVPPETGQSWVDRARSLGRSLQKQVVQVRDQPGFAAARMALALGLEAMRLLEAGVASADDLDALMTLGYGHPVGPIELSDRIGLDLRLAIAERLASSGEARFLPPANLRSKVSNGHSGTKATRGFFRWDQLGRRW